MPFLSNLFTGDTLFALGDPLPLERLSGILFSFPGQQRNFNIPAHVLARKSSCQPPSSIHERVGSAVLLTPQGALSLVPLSNHPRNRIVRSPPIRIDERSRLPVAFGIYALGRSKKRKRIENSCNISYNDSLFHKDTLNMKFITVSTRESGIIWIVNFLTMRVTASARNFKLR